MVLVSAELNWIEYLYCKLPGVDEKHTYRISSNKRRISNKRRTIDT